MKPRFWEQRSNVRKQSSRQAPNLSSRQLPPATVPQKTQIVLRELIDNSLRYRDPSRTPRVVIGAEADENTVRVRVADNGTGVASAYADQTLSAPAKAGRRPEWVRTGAGDLARHCGDGRGKYRIRAVRRGASFVFEIPCQQSKSVNSATAVSPGKARNPGCCAELRKAVNVHGLSQITVRVQFVGAGNVPLRTGTGQNHHGDASEPRILLDLRQNLMPVLAGQIQIQQDQIGAGVVPGWASRAASAEPQRHPPQPFSRGESGPVFKERLTRSTSALLSSTSKMVRFTD